jgi:hypothetical protein
MAVPFILPTPFFHREFRRSIIDIKLFYLSCFKKVFNQDTDDLNNIINAPITIDEIKSAMKNLKNNKASGEDSFPKQLTIVIGL